MLEFETPVMQTYFNFINFCIVADIYFIMYRFIMTTTTFEI